MGAVIPRDRRLPLALHALGMAVVGYGVVVGRSVELYGAWVAWATALAIAAWAIVEVLPRPDDRPGRRPALTAARRAATLVGVAVASFSVVPTNGTHLAPQAVLIIVAIADDGPPVWLGATAAAIAVVLTPLGAVATHASPSVSYLAAVAVWVLIGITRRQAAVAIARTRELEARQLEARAQEARAGALAARQAAARDIHDVLAHSLGGLVIQLDAAEALLEAGRVGDARVTVSQARVLAAEGLADSRRAVTALRAPDEPALGDHVGRAGPVGDGGAGLGEPVRDGQAGPRSEPLGARGEAVGPSRRSEPVGPGRRGETGGDDEPRGPFPVAPATDLRDAAERLLRAHRQLGGQVAAHLDLARTAGPIPAPLAGAFARALQEALSNARRHAPGTPVEASLVATDELLTLTVSNPLVPAAVGAGRLAPAAVRGHGLAGMAERFALLPGGAATAGEHDGRFVVRARARVAAG